MEEYIPSVIEPAFGIGRIMYSMLEHNFKIRTEDVQRKVKDFRIFSLIHAIILVYYITTFDCTI